MYTAWQGGFALYWCADGPLNGTDWKNDPFKPRQLNFHSSKIQTYGDYKGKTGMLVRPASNGIHDVRVTEKDLVRVDKLLVAFQFRGQQMQHVRPVQSIKKFLAGIPCCIQRLAQLCHIRNERHVFRYYHQQFLCFLNSLERNILNCRQIALQCLVHNLMQADMVITAGLLVKRICARKQIVIEMLQNLDPRCLLNSYYTIFSKNIEKLLQK